MDENQRRDKQILLLIIGMVILSVGSFINGMIGIVQIVLKW